MAVSSEYLRYVVMGDDIGAVHVSVIYWSDKCIVCKMSKDRSQLRVLALGLGCLCLCLCYSSVDLIEILGKS